MCTRLPRLLKTSLNINTSANIETKNFCVQSSLLQSQHLFSPRLSLFQHPLSFLLPVTSPRLSNSHPFLSVWRTGCHWQDDASISILYICLFVKAPVPSSFLYSTPLFHTTCRNSTPWRCQAGKEYMISFCLQTGVEADG